VLDAIAFRDRRGLKRAIAEAILAQPARFAHPDAVSYVCQLAQLLVFRDRELSTRLLNFAYENMPPREREFHLERLDFLVGMGRYFGSLSPEGQEFWAAVLADPDRDPWDGRGP